MYFWNEREGGRAVLTNNVAFANPKMIVRPAKPVSNNSAWSFEAKEWSYINFRLFAIRTNELVV